ncbi:hypothetical protein PILCRDRAFT_91999 [Piloderma croceum F 1598]|uniref:Membrane insertase YidC/Oxa/ALB C-terminal domain-containing protein n=1 Tax=Piloderma croceum (strain F 1598) TaxID=765440 RepID=A0A0C3ET11_PILCF|nr:hypothetical protein PILCRDRAFT_91999 [Piloderma croceum F 1598]
MTDTVREATTCRIHMFSLKRGCNDCHWVDHAKAVEGVLGPAVCDGGPILYCRMARLFVIPYCERPRLHIPKPYLATIPNSRNFWGSPSTPSKSPSQPSTIQPTDRPVTSDLQTPAFNENTSTAEPEPIWAGTSEPLTSNAELASSVDAPPSSVTDFITPDMVPPLQYGDLADLGLISWTPAGLIRWSFEVMQVSTGIPWFWTIVAGTIFWRIILLPLNIRGSRNVARMTIHAPELEAANKRLKSTAGKEGPDRQRAMKELADVYAKAGVSPRSVFLVPLVPLPVMIGLFFGVKGMCEHPIEQLKHSGFDLLPDLTAITSVADPYFILPIIVVATMNLQMKLAARDTDPKKASNLHIFNILRAASPLFALFMSQLPVGVAVYALTSIIMSLVITSIMQRSAVRNVLNLPPLPANPPKLPTFMESRQALLKSLHDGVKAAEEQAKNPKP